MLQVIRILVVLSTLLLGIYPSSEEENDEMPIAVKRYVNFNLLKPYLSRAKDDDPFERPIILQTRDARNKLDCILNLRSFELCRGRF